MTSIGAVWIVTIIITGVGVIEGREAVVVANKLAGLTIGSVAGKLLPLSRTGTPRSSHSLNFQPGVCESRSSSMTRNAGTSAA